MKILIYSSVFFPSIGGIENHTLFLAREFVAAGHEVKIVTEQAQDPAKPLSDLEVLHSTEKAEQLKVLFWCDLIYMPNITLKGAWLLAVNPTKKWVVSHNDFHLDHSNNLKTRLKKLLIRFANRNIAVSESVAHSLNVDCKVIYNCYDEAVFKLYPEERRQLDFVVVGRLVSQKGCAMLIDACAKLKRPFTLSIVGDGPEKGALKDKVRQFGLQRQIGFMGFVGGEELARTLNRHRVMIVPSLGVEGFGIVALEGLACGCKMIVSNAGGLAEAVNGHGKIFEMGDVDALAALLDQALIETDDEVMPEACQRYLHRQSKANVARKYLQIFAH